MTDDGNQSAPLGYEFTSQENGVFSDVASSMKFVAILLIILGVINGLSAFIGNFGGLVAGVVYLAIGIWTKSAGASIQKIVDTEGNEIAHLMGAMGDLGKLYKFQKWAFIVVFVAVAVLGTLGVIGSQSG